MTNKEIIKNADLLYNDLINSFNQNNLSVYDQKIILDYLQMRILQNMLLYNNLVTEQEKAAKRNEEVKLDDNKKNS